MHRKFSLWQKLKAYKLQNNIYVIVMLLGSIFAAIIVYISPLQEVRFVPELTLAIATSLLATIFGLVSDVYVKYKTFENDQLLEGIHEFGISNLHFNKKLLLENLLQSSDKEVWISGYRLILTSKITTSIAQAIKQGAVVKILVSPPWNDSFKLVYGDNDRVIDNYCKVFSAIAKACAEMGTDVDKICEVRFTHKPLFNDTYKVDMNLITGPYMHNQDEEHQRITANDFFTYDLIKKSRLYTLVENEYLTVWHEAGEMLQWSKYMTAAEYIRTNDLREREKVELLHNSCIPTPAHNAPKESVAYIKQQA